MAASSRTRAKPRPKRKPARRSPADLLQLPVLEQRHLDLLGLALVCLGVFTAFTAYLDWDGGRVGDALADGARWAVGAAAVVVPVALVAAGVVLVLRPVLPSVRPFKAGAVCLLLSVTLGLSAGTFGLGPDGGELGDQLFKGTDTTVGHFGAHLVAVFLFLAGVLLISGASIAGVLRTTGRGMSEATRRVRPIAERGAEVTAAARARIAPPEPADEELVVRATHVEAPPLDGATRFPDLFGPGEEPEPDPEPQQTIEFEEPEPEPEPADPQPKVPVKPVLADDAEEVGVTKTGEAPRDGSALEPHRVPKPGDEDFVWEVPEPGFLKRSTAEQNRPDGAGQEKVARQLVEALGHFGIEAQVTGMVSGPHITRYELRLAPGIKVSKVAQLKDDLAYALAATDIRILAPIPGKQAVGVEVPNAQRRIVHLGDVLQEPPKDWSPLTVWLGKDVAGRAIGADLAKMPHLLVAGTTGAGKSGAVNAMLASILLRATPQEVRLLLVDPKQVELNHYDEIPHLLTPVITNPRQAANALQNLVREMEQRYGLMSLVRTRNLIELNKIRRKHGEPPLPYILCVIDELADLMMVAPADVEDSIIRLAQKARAVGIHLVLATQSPRVDVITGMIKANVPSRIAFAVSSQTDSRVILDQNGAETLLGQGDMLFSPVGSSRLQRIQGAYVDEAQIARITEAWRTQGEPEFQEELLEEVEEEPVEGGNEDGLDPDEDPLLAEAIQLVAQMGTASTSMLQRRLRLGYTRAGRLIDMLERRGVISGYEGSKPRQVLISESDLPRVLAGLADRGEPAPVGGDEDDGADTLD
jgi:DNA segregation ATPase FtsK/SpoIIIE, S-DNA-T family